MKYIYLAILFKQNIIWRKEPREGQLHFSHSGDRMALQFIATILKLANRQYDAVQQSRNIRLDRLLCFEADELVYMRSVSIDDDFRPVMGAADTKKILDLVFPRQNATRVVTPELAHYLEWSPRIRKVDSDPDWYPPYIVTEG
jgi:hypothetical protein